MKDFNHPNVLSLIGVAIKDNNKPFVILPYMEHGDLKSYISNPDRVRINPPDGVSCFCICFRLGCRLRLSQNILIVSKLVVYHTDHDKNDGLKIH